MRTQLVTTAIWALAILAIMQWSLVAAANAKEETAAAAGDDEVVVDNINDIDLSKYEAMADEAPTGDDVYYGEHDQQEDLLVSEEDYQAQLEAEAEKQAALQRGSGKTVESFTEHMELRVHEPVLREKGVDAGINPDEYPISVTFTLEVEREVSSTSPSSFNVYPPFAWYLLSPPKGAKSGHPGLEKVEFSVCGGRFRRRWDNGTRKSHRLCNMPTLSTSTTNYARRANADQLTASHRRVASAIGASFSTSMNILARSSDTQHVPLHRLPVGYSTLGPDHSFVSLHSVHSEHFCTQHLSPLLHLFPGAAATAPAGTVENYPQGLVKRLLLTPDAFFSTPFHHADLKMDRKSDMYGGQVQITRLRVGFTITSDVARMMLSNNWRRSCANGTALGSKSASSSTIEIIKGETTNTFNVSDATGTKEAAEAMFNALSGAGKKEEASKLSSGPLPLPHISGSLKHEGEARGHLHFTVNFPEKSIGANVLATVPLHVILPFWTRASCRRQGTTADKTNAIAPYRLTTQLDSDTNVQLAVLSLERKAFKATVEEDPNVISDENDEATNDEAYAESIEDETIVECSVPYTYPSVRAAHYTPDANKPFFLPPLAVQFAYSAAHAEALGGGVDAPPPFDGDDEIFEEKLKLPTLEPHVEHVAQSFDLARMSQMRNPDAPKWIFTHVWLPEEVYMSDGADFVTTLPSPDVSMPFNALVLTMTSFVLLWGFVFGLTVRDQV